MGSAEEARQEQENRPVSPETPPPEYATLPVDGLQDAQSQIPPPEYPAEKTGVESSTAPPPPPPVMHFPPPPPRQDTEDFYRNAPPSAVAGVSQNYDPSDAEHLRPALPARPSSAMSNKSSTGQSKADDTGDQPKESFNERMYRWSNKAAGPINKFTNRLGSEGWWPTTLDVECDKCARILRSFVQDGVVAPNAAPSPSSTPAAAAPSTTSPPTEPQNPDPSSSSPYFPPPPLQPTPTTATTTSTATSGSSPNDPTNPGPKYGNKWTNPRSIIKIPSEVIRRAKGIAIYTAFRTGGPYLGGMGGSGVVLARLPDGSWSPPCGILPNSISLGMMMGIDVYDCVCVLNTQEAVDAFAHRARFSFGGALGVAAGPVGVGGTLESDFKNAKPVWAYARSRGFYAGAQAEGTVVVIRPDANGSFYGEKGITAGRILKGDVKQPTGGGGPGERGTDGGKMWPEGAEKIMAVLREAEGTRMGEEDKRLVEEVKEGPKTAGETENPEAVVMGAMGEGKGDGKVDEHEQQQQQQPWYKKWKGKKNEGD